VQRSYSAMSVACGDGREWGAWRIARRAESEEGFRMGGAGLLHAPTTRPAGRCAGSSHGTSDQHAGSHPSQRATAKPQQGNSLTIVSHPAAMALVASHQRFATVPLGHAHRAAIDPIATSARRGTHLLLQSSASGCFCHHCGIAPLSSSHLDPPVTSPGQA